MNYPADVAEDLLRTLQTEAKRSPSAESDPRCDSRLRRFVCAAASVPVASEEMFVNSNDGQPIWRRPPRLAGPADSFMPLRPDSRPQTLPLQSPVPTPSRPRRAMTAPLPFAVHPAPQNRRRGQPAGGSWLTVLLYLVVLASGAALVAFTFLRPYLSIR